MLEKPPLSDRLLLDRVRAAFDLPAVRVAFLPLGYDANTAVYRVDGQDGRAFFLKLRKGPFAAVTLALPAFLRASGIQAVMAPLPARSGQLWAELDPYKLILYPFVEGVNGWAQALSAEQWRVFGAALRSIHTAALPPELARPLPREDFGARWREQVRDFQARAATDRFADPAAHKLAALMRDRRALIERLLALTETLADDVRRRDLPCVLCHADLHAGNLLLSPEGGLFIVDWDAPILAPKERDLMFIGAGVGQVWDSARETERFYRGYGPAQVDRAALAYYRCERVIADIAAFCEQLLLTEAGGADREQAYRFFAGIFQPGHELDIAFETASEGG